LEFHFQNEKHLKKIKIMGARLKRLSVRKICQKHFTSFMELQEESMEVEVQEESIKLISTAYWAGNTAFKSPSPPIVHSCFFLHLHTFLCHFHKFFIFKKYPFFNISYYII